MKNFTFYNPVKLVFGHGQISHLASLIPPQSKVLLAYGGGSIKANGVYDQVCANLAKDKLVEFAGIEVNPEYDTLLAAVALCKQQQIDFILAVGGGSVIDGCKFIALASKYAGDPWEILSQTSFTATQALPLGVIQTLPATGSEMNCGAVISRRSLAAKQAFSSPLVYPQFAIFDPTTTYSLPLRQRQNGIIDPFIHVTEQYLTSDLNTPIQDGFAEAILSTLIQVGPAIVNGSQDYATCANWCWAATNALNGYIGIGVDQDWATHLIGHQLTAAYGLDHGQTLAIIAPQLWRHQLNYKRAKLLKLAHNVWHLGQQATPEDAITACEHFFHSLGIKTRLSEYGINANPQKIAAMVFSHDSSKIGENHQIDANIVAEIVAMAS